MRMLQVVLMVAGATLAAGCNSAAKDAPLPPTPVRVAVAIDGPAAPSIRTNGRLANKDEMRLAFKVGGVIRQLAVAEGEAVRKGQKLAEIEQTEVNAQVEQAAQACEKARRDVARGERLYADKVISLEQLQDLRTQAAMAEAALNSARFNWNYAAIVAPRDGTVLRQLAEERELVAAGAPVLIFGGQDRGFVVRAGLADREIVQVRIGDAVHVRLDALPDAKLEGKVAEIASASDPASGMFDVEIALDCKRLPLKSGLVAKLTIVPASASIGQRVYVPIGAIVEGDGRTARLFVLDKDRARRRDIEVAFIEGAIVALASGVDAGEQVITDGALYLEDGERVAIFPPIAAGAQP
jgi:membrane fusion protein, multidrug efflux system